MKEVPIIEKPVHWFLYDRDLRHERVKSYQANTDIETNQFICSSNLLTSFYVKITLASYGLKSAVITLGLCTECVCS